MITSSQFIEFHEKIDILKHLHRTGWGMKGVPNSETVAAHSWRMAFMAMQREEELNALHVNTQRIIEMCLLHDVSEAVVGDIVPEHEQLSDKKILPAEKKAMETHAVETFSEKYNFPKLKALFNEYEAHQTPEARIVKNLDKIDMILQAYEYLKMYPELTKLHDFLRFNEHAVNLPIFASDIQEIKNRQAGATPRKNDFIDLQITAGMMKHIPYPFSQKSQQSQVITLADHAFSIGIMALHLEDNLQRTGLNVAEIIRRAIICNFGKITTYTITYPATDYHFIQTDETKTVFDLSQRYNATFLYEKFNEIHQPKTPENLLMADLCMFEDISQISDNTQIHSNKYNSFNKILQHIDTSLFLSGKNDKTR